MKKLIIAISFITLIQAQSQTISNRSKIGSTVTLVGGVNMSNVEFNQDMSDNFDLNYKLGLNIGLEKTFHFKSLNSLKVGGAFIQRGFDSVFTVWDQGIVGGIIEFSTSYEATFEYICTYALYDLNWGVPKLDKYLPIFVGLELGVPMGGKAKSSNGEESIEADDLNSDYGIVLGADYIINSQVGIRVSYYKGLNDVVAAGAGEEGSNYKSKSLVFNILYNL